MCHYKELPPDKIEILITRDGDNTWSFQKIRHLVVKGVTAIFFLTLLILFLIFIYHNNPLFKRVQDVDNHFDKDYSRASYYSWIAAEVQGGQNNEPNERVVSCYYNAPGPTDKHALLPLNIQLQLCTHINIAFASVANCQMKLDPNLISAIEALVSQKKAYPNLKILLSVGGSNKENGFSEMVKNHANRKLFIKSIKSILRKYKLDGVDLDWEFPGVRNMVELPNKRERQHFSQLLREIKLEYEREKRNYLLTVAVAAPDTIVDAAYDVDQLNLYADYVNVMTYDYHFFSKFTPFTGLNSPLYARPSEQLYMATLNINYTVHMYLSKGLDPSKIVVGIPTYGHSFKLVNPNNPSIGSPASDYGSMGHSGFVDFTDVCLYVNAIKNATIVRENSTKVPYLYYNDLWVSYDDPQSVIDKANYVKRQGLRGAMIYSLNADDHLGVCEGELSFGNHFKFPLVHAIKSVLGPDNKIVSSEE